MDDLFSKGRNELVMPDGAKVHLCTRSDLENSQFLDKNVKWLTENPGTSRQSQSDRVGRQMFTGSFHPVEDKLWEDRENWDSRLPPKTANTLPTVRKRMR